MSPPAGTIDLGELPHGDQPEIKDPWPGRAALRRWPARRSWRVAGAGAITALVLVMAPAAGTPPQPLLTLELTVQAADYGAVTDEQRLYLFDNTGSSAAVVAAHQLDTGTLAWRVAVPGERANLTLAGEALLVTTYAEDPDEFGPTDRTTLLDRSSGRAIWTRAGWPLRIVDDRMLFSSSQSTYGQDEHPLSSISAVDLATGDETWRIDANRWDYGFADTSTRLVTLDSESTLATYDLATGELLATTPTAAPTDPLRDSYWAALSIVGPLVFLTEELDGEFVLSAYDIATLQRQWTLAGQQGLTLWPTLCGDLVCLNDPLGVPRAVDPDSGATVWSADWLPSVTGEGGYDIFDPGQTELAGHAILRDIRVEADQRRSRSWLIDLATGDPVLDLRQWDFTGQLMLTMSTDTGTWIGRLRPDLSGVDALGRIESATINEYGYGTHCSPHPTLVVCYTDVLDGDPLSHTSVEVWRLR